MARTVAYIWTDADAFRRWCLAVKRCELGSVAAYGAGPGRYVDHRGPYGRLSTKRAFSRNR